VISFASQVFHLFNKQQNSKYNFPSMYAYVTYFAKYTQMQKHFMLGRAMPLFNILPITTPANYYLMSE